MIIAKKVATKVEHLLDRFLKGKIVIISAVKDKSMKIEINRIVRVIVKVMVMFKIITIKRILKIKTFVLE